MIFLQNLRKKLHHFFLKRKLGKLELQHSIVHFEKAKTIGVLFDATKSKDRKIALEFIEYLKSTGKTIEHLSYLNKKVKEKHFAFNHFTDKQVGFIYKPRGYSINQFLYHNFDLLISLNTTENLPLEYIAALAKAKYRVGRFDSEKIYCYDLMIDVGQEEDLDHYIKLIHHYLNDINKDVETV